MASKPLRLLMLGGTNFVGPRLVQAALDRGHEVTLFNRGKTNPGLFPQLEKLRGNRYPDRGQGLAALRGERRWDAVLDTWQGDPGCIDLTARMFAERTERYLYISSIAVYRNYRDVGMTEEGPLLDASEHLTSFDSEIGYSMRKRAGEQAIENVYDRDSILLRCTSIQGSNGTACETVSRDLGYWGYRFVSGGPVLAPDDRTAAFQLIDAADMADFAVRAIEKNLGGPYNMVGPEEPLFLHEYIRAWEEIAESRSEPVEIVWADPEWLLEEGVRVFQDIRNWIPADRPEPGFYRISNEKALEHGLVYRSLKDTLRDTIRCVTDSAQLITPSVGMSRERELSLIHEWRRQS